MDFIATRNTHNWTDKIQRMMFERNKEAFKDFIATDKENPCLYNIMLCAYPNHREYESSTEAMATLLSDGIPHCSTSRMW
jgi:hypothetical protein